MAEIKNFPQTPDPIPPKEVQEAAPARNPVSKPGEIHRPWYRNVLTWIVSDDVGDVKSEVIKPAVRDLIFGVVTRYIYGANSPANTNSPGRRNYNQPVRDFRNGQSGGSHVNNPENRNRLALNDYKYASVETAMEAQAKLSEMLERANEYGGLTVGGFWDILGVTRELNPVEEDWGWYHDMLASVIWKRNPDGRFGWTLPRPVYMK